MRSASSWAWRWLVVCAFVLALAAVSALAFVYFLDHLSGDWGATRLAAMAGGSTAILAYLVSGPLKRNPGLWVVVALITLIGVCYALEAFGLRHRGSTSASALFALLGGMAGSGFHLFSLIEKPQPVLETNRWRPIELRDRDWDQEVRVALADIASSPQRFEAAYEKAAVVLWGAGRRSEALAILNDAVQRFPSRRSFAARADYLQQSGRLLEALADFDRAIELDSNPGAPFVMLLNRAELLCKVGQFGRALKDARRMTELEPDSSIAFSLRADIHDSLGMIELANRDREKSQQLRDHQDYRFR